MQTAAMLKFQPTILIGKGAHVLVDWLEYGTFVYAIGTLEPTRLNLNSEKNICKRIINWLFLISLKSILMCFLDNMN